MTKRKPAEVLRILSIDTSLSSPGFAVVEIRNRKPKLVAVDHVKPRGDEPYVLRTKHIESWLHLFVRQHRPFDVIVREGFNAKFESSNYPVFSAWASVDRVLYDFGYVIVEKSISPTTVKRLMTDQTRKVTKQQVEDGVRKFIELPVGFAFKKDDESDAVGIALSWALENGLIDDVIEREKKPKAKSKRKKTKKE
ncbi:crossover junction endodeoxyribonuclease RuvC [Fictibacillus sp. Mic-4]|uniref:crossover junction endodeoxyribonuclease RuvC n=1 Tax=Fictibacillus sp. Mic-4 TaxID=3132826 RepID=UPI003CED44AD